MSTAALVRRGTGRVHVASATEDGWKGICGRSVLAEPVCPNEEAPVWAMAHEKLLCGNCRELAILAAGDD